MSADASTGTPPAVGTCARCGEPLAEGFAFCESCGAPTGSAAAVPEGAATAPVEAVDGELSARTTLFAHPDGEPTVDVRAAEPEPVERCACGGRFEGGWCDTCGAGRPDPGDHVVVTISAALGSVSDRGVVHHQNEDAGTVVDLGGAVACVVADGVSSAEGSRAASTAAVEATRDALVAGARRVDDGAVDWSEALRGVRAEAAVAAASPELRSAGEAPSCTWVAAVADDGDVWVSWVGDSRAYLVEDSGRGRCLTTDHSWAAEAIAAGVPHDEAMADSRAHMITAWLGGDAPELPDATAHARAATSGWLLVVSDGLWNYCDEGDDLADLVRRLGGPTLTATALAEALVGFATAAGGADNITVAAARIAAPRPGTADPDGAPPEPPAAGGTTPAAPPSPGGPTTAGA